MSQNLITDQLAAFFSQFSKRRLKKKEILIRAEEIPQGIFFIEDGMIRQYAVSPKGEEVVLNIFRAPAFFPIQQIFQEKPSAYYYEAMSDSVVWVAQKHVVREFLLNHPDIVLDLVDRISRGIDGYMQRIVALMSGTAYERVIVEILLYARRFGNSEKKPMALRISAKQLAIQSGLTRETVTREISILKQRGFITFEKNQLIILNLDTLEKELEKE